MLVVSELFKVSFAPFETLKAPALLLTSLPFIAKHGFVPASSILKSVETSNNGPSVKAALIVSTPALVVVLDTYLWMVIVLVLTETLSLFPGTYVLSI